MNNLPRKLQNVPKLQEELKKRPEIYWKSRGNKMALNLFREMSLRVPAYKDFLKNRNFEPNKVKTISDFKKIPLINKDNYLRKYSRNMLCWDNDFSNRQWVISTTSGSTGEPYYFPRNELQEYQLGLSTELYLRENFDIQNKTTLYIDAFAMGAWIGGLFTYESIKILISKGYKISIITPGIHKQEVINSVKNLGADFDQVIIACYPPMMKDILDLGILQGIDWGDYNLGLIFSAEGFGEKFRSHVHNLAKIKSKYTGSLNHYGTVDQGTLGHETSTSILIREYADINNRIFHKLFGEGRKQPTLVQYLPELFYFENVQGRVVCSSHSGLPLVRYDVNDAGGIISNSKIEKIFTEENLSFSKIVKDKNIENHRWNLPYVYLTEREDFSVKLMGGMIYPEEIRKALLSKDVVDSVTGRFTMEVIKDRNMNPKLVINVEMVKDINRNHLLSSKIQKNVLHNLLSENSEFVSNYSTYGKKLNPRIILWDYEHVLYFHGRGKQKWVKK